MDDPPSPIFPETKMMDMEVADMDQFHNELLNELNADYDMISSGLSEL